MRNTADAADAADTTTCDDKILAYTRFTMQRAWRTE